MKLIIDIPEVFYEYCKAQEDAIEIQLAVKNGIPLDDLRAEIEQKYEKYKYLFDEDFMGTKDLEWVLSVINRHKGEQS